MGEKRSANDHYKRTNTNLADKSHTALQSSQKYTEKKTENPWEGIET